MPNISLISRHIVLGSALLGSTACALHISPSGAAVSSQLTATPAPAVAMNAAAKRPASKRGKVTVIPAAAKKTHDSLWDRLTNGFDLGDKSREEVEKEVHQLTRHPRATQALLKRSQTHLWEIVEATEARDLPLELALLPAVESRFNPRARSPKNALGLWQFMPNTARQHGLEQNWWVDSRLDVTESTHAALDYLQSLYQRYDEWPLALAAYNCGEACLRRAIRKADGNDDFWSLELPGETRRYVPKLLALAHVVEEHEDYGITLPALANQQMTDTVIFERQIDLALAAKHARIPLKTLQRLNPALHRWATPPDGPHRLRVPAGKSQQLQTAMQNVPVSEWTQWQSYFVEEGDSLSVIAQRHGINTRDLKRFNKLNSNMIRTGQALLLPTSVALAKTPDRQQRPVASPPANAVRLDYVIQTGDTLWDVARAHRVTVSELSRWNGLQTNSILRPGKTLVVWVSAATDAHRAG